MQIYHLHDFIGEFERNHLSPNSYYCKPLDLTIILRVRANPKPNQTKYYLVYRFGKGKAHYLSALWSSPSSTAKAMNEWTISDTQGVKGYVSLNLYSLIVKKA